MHDINQRNHACRESAAVYAFLDKTWPSPGGRPVAVRRRPPRLSKYAEVLARPPAVISLARMHRPRFRLPLPFPTDGRTDRDSIGGRADDGD